MRHKVKKMRERDEAFCHTFCLNIFPIKLAIIKKKKSYHMSIIKTCLLVKGKAKYFFHQRKRSDACKRQLLCFIRRRFFFTVLHTCGLGLGSGMKQQIIVTSHADFSCKHVIELHYPGNFPIATPHFFFQDLSAFQNIFSLLNICSR